MPFRNTDDERPLAARSVLLSTLLGAHPPELPVRVLVRSGELFGIAEGTVRVALSRMLAAGEVVTTDGRYRLAGRLLERQARQDESRRPVLRKWRGDWTVAAVTAEGRTASSRVALRAAMRDLRMAELREGVWLRPANLRLPRREEAVQCTWLSARPEGDTIALAGRLWDLASWARRAEELVGRMRRVQLDDADALAPGFVLSAAALRHFQADPLLPDALLPASWPGPALRDEFDRFDEAFLATWRSFMTP
jgi:phenylacetic acid degradation operon negative regulatory protein